MQEKRIRRSFTPEFKQRAVEKVLIDGMLVADVARDLGINRVSLDNWVKAASSKTSEMIRKKDRERKAEVLEDREAAKEEAEAKAEAKAKEEPKEEKELPPPAAAKPAKEEKAAPETKPEPEAKASQPDLFAPEAEPAVSRAPAEPKEAEPKKRVIKLRPKVKKEKEEAPAASEEIKVQAEPELPPPVQEPEIAYSAPAEEPELSFEEPAAAYNPPPLQVEEAPKTEELPVKEPQQPRPEGKKSFEKQDRKEKFQRDRKEEGADKNPPQNGEKGSKDQNQDRFQNKKKNFNQKQNNSRPQDQNRDQQPRPEQIRQEPDFQAEEVVELTPPKPLRRSNNCKWFVEDALDQQPAFRERNEALGYKDKFQIPASDIERMWSTLQSIKDNVDKQAFGKMVAQAGLNVSEQTLANPRQKNVGNDNRMNRKPWQKPSPKMDPVAAEFFKTVPDYAKSVYEYVGPLCLKLAPNSLESPILSCEGNDQTGWEMEVDFSKFDRFVDDFYGGFVNECKTILMQKNPKEYHSLNAFIRYPDHPAWNPKLWAGERKFKVGPRESFAHAWLRSINEI